MENYIIVEELGKGAQGTTYFVKHKTIPGNYCLKKIECNDECDIYKAFHEMSSFCSLDNPYLSKLKEIFITWDEKECAQCLCTVVECFSSGSLGKFLNSQRNLKKEFLDEELIKRWFGQIIEGLTVLHESQNAHRDLKCNNIYLSCDHNILLGDYCAPAVMGDIRMRPRVPKESTTNFAPELLSSPFNEKSDLWSLGSVALEIATCGCLDSSEVEELIISMKEDPDALYEILNTLNETYSCEFTDFIRNLLVNDPNERPSLDDVKNLPFVVEVLNISGSALVERRKRQAVTIDHCPVPVHDGFEAVMKYLVNQMYNELCVKAAMEWLALECAKFDLTANDKVNIAVVALDNIVSSEICIAAIKIFSHCIIFAQENDTIYTKPIIVMAIRAMKDHPDNLDLQLIANAFLMALSENNQASHIIGQEGGIECIFRAIRNFPDNSNLFVVGCDALWSLCVVEKNTELATIYEGMKTVCEGLIKHSSLPEAVENSALCILSFSTEESNVEIARDMNLQYFLLTALKEHIGYTKLVKNILSALSSFVEICEECALLTLQCEINGSESIVTGIPIFLQVYEVHKDNIEIVEILAKLIIELFKYADIIPSVKFDNLILELADMHAKYKKNETVICAYNVVNQRLQCMEA